MANQFKGCKNMGELFDIARKVIDREEAKKFFNEYVDFIVTDNGKVTYAEAVQMAHSNLGYFAGYYGPDVQLHIQKMYGSAHPIFGTLTPTPEEAFEMGQKIGSGK